MSRIVVSKELIEIRDKLTQTSDTLAREFEVMKASQIRSNPNYIIAVKDRLDYEFQLLFEELDGAESMEYPTALSVVYDAINETDQRHEADNVTGKQARNVLKAIVEPKTRWAFMKMIYKSYRDELT